jgi:hypothetical protein
MIKALTPEDRGSCNLAHHSGVRFILGIIGCKALGASRTRRVEPVTESQPKLFSSDTDIDLQDMPVMHAGGLVFGCHLIPLKAKTWSVSPA